VACHPPSQVALNDLPVSRAQTFGGSLLDAFLPIALQRSPAEALESVM
jgi:hypothetical protein